MAARQNSQRAKVLRYLQAGNTITPIEALNMFGCFRLSAIIFDIKNKDGVNVYTEMVSEGDKRFAKYYIV